ncbi:MAG: PDZ domain-containing protein [Chloroflexi bacterium]|nr:PDZ domain-containing protein [Chloroflexota bacterium]
MRRRWGLVSVIVVAALVVAALAGAWGRDAVVRAQGSPARTPTAAASASAPATQGDVVAALEGTLANIYDRVSPSVVHIEVREVASARAQGYPFGQQQQAPQQYTYGSGSGFVWDTEGHIVTNNHVVEGADLVKVRFHDGTVLEAKVVGTDPDSDLAVVQVDAPAALLVPVKLADSTVLKVGQLAVAIGNPFNLENTMTVGFVSALGRSMPVSNQDTITSTYSIPDIIQTDAPINPGNSGGVLVDRNGQVIGVTSAIVSPSDASAGIGFAVPSVIVAKVVPVLIKTGEYVDPWMGISGTTLSPEAAAAMDLKADQRGALVIDVVTGGPAEKAGLIGSDRSITVDQGTTRVGGDVIVAINGEPVKSFDDLVTYLARHSLVGDKITLTVLRGGREQEVSLTLGARPEAGAETASAETPEATAWFGISGQTLDASLAEAMNLDSGQTGVLVQQVASGSPADKAGIRGSFRPVVIGGQRYLIGGDVIIAWEGQRITSAGDLQEALAQVQPGDSVTVTILRSGQERDLTVTLEARPTP